MIVDTDSEPFDRFVGGCPVRTRVGDRIPAARARPGRGALQAHVRRQQGLVSHKAIVFLSSMCEYWRVNPVL